MQISYYGINKKILLFEKDLCHEGLFVNIMPDSPVFVFHDLN